MPHVGCSAVRVLQDDIMPFAHAVAGKAQPRAATLPAPIRPQARPSRVLDLKAPLLWCFPSDDLAYASAARHCTHSIDRVLASHSMHAYISVSRQVVSD